MQILILLVLVIVFAIVLRPRKKKEPAANLPPEETKDDLAEVIIASLRLRPQEWEIGQHTMKHSSGIELWTANRPYGDMKLWSGGHEDEIFVGTQDQRKILRGMIDDIKTERQGKQWKLSRENAIEKIMHKHGKS